MKDIWYFKEPETLWNILKCGEGPMGSWKPNHWKYLKDPGMKDSEVFKRPIENWKTLKYLKYKPSAEACVELNHINVVNVKNTFFGGAGGCLLPPPESQIYDNFRPGHPCIPKKFLYTKCCTWSRRANKSWNKSCLFFQLFGFVVFEENKKTFAKRSCATIYI